MALKPVERRGKRGANGGERRCLFRTTDALDGVGASPNAVEEEETRGNVLQGAGRRGVRNPGAGSAVPTGSEMFFYRATEGRGQRTKNRCRPMCGSGQISFIKNTYLYSKVACRLQSHPAISGWVAVVHLATDSGTPRGGGSSGRGGNPCSPVFGIWVGDIV